MAAETPRVALPVSGGRNLGRALAGVALLMPLLALWLVTLVPPTLSTVAMGFQNASPLRDAEWVGAANYSHLATDSRFGASVDFTLGLVRANLLAVAVLPPLLALGLAAFGRWLRLPVRLLFTLPLACFAPVGAALAWRLALSPQGGIVGRLTGAETAWLGDADRAALALQVVGGLSAAAVGCGVGLVVYGWALRGVSQEGPRPAEVGWPLAVTWALSLLTTAAVSLQSFVPSYVLTAGGPAGRTTTLALLQFQHAFQQLRFGLGAATATLQLVPLGLLGLAAGVLVAASGARLRTVPADTPPLQLGGPARVAAGLLILGALLAGAAVLAAAVGVPALGAAATAQMSPAEALRPDGPLLPAQPADAAYEQLDEELPAARLIANSLTPPLAALMGALPVAYFGALAIGGLRPLGRHSAWLLIPFSPWLFVGAGPLGVALYQSRADLSLINTLPGLIPPVCGAIPMLFVLTLFFRGQEPRWRAGGGFVRTMLLPSLPLAALLGFGALLLAAQDLLWPLLVSTDPELYTASVALAQFGGQFGPEAPLIAAAVVRLGQPLLLPALLVFGALQLFFLDRLALVVGRDVEECPA